MLDISAVPDTEAKGSKYLQIVGMVLIKCLVTSVVVFWRLYLPLGVRACPLHVSHKVCECLCLSTALPNFIEVQVSQCVLMCLDVSRCVSECLGVS